MDNSPKMKMLMQRCIADLRRQYPNASDEEIKQMAVDKCKKMMMAGKLGC